MLLTVLAGANALAVPFKINPSIHAAADVKISDVGAESLKSFHYSTIENAYPYIGRKTVKGAITAQIIKDACGIQVRSGLKTPSVAKFARISAPIYFQDAGTYNVTGSVDSQNSYGAMVRGVFFCTSAFEGDGKGGTLYTKADILFNN
ncbi:hypothetical protein [Deinococcus wulumuqiensis]|uniref:DUF4402 domain-containing protein n=1 Tax=Deinococcus wulumuqiensis TaxID=980427 RepID=A0AAV4K158_9DEIO|nr:hypothetical protein [Deinococcus wulumuqiensis]QII20182.1 hypothetical protein G6R31_04920 [Deinococcus wulumuqiensis R12]GGI75399.1 hypothetical protein GCM10010914_07030 [Deinococcus wulumuqiensis]GGP28719.1 hypothetical protein GCM10008021_03700 [Deinococcus wulumuqiensis]